jgi:hypothetical protein
MNPYRSSTQDACVVDGARRGVAYDLVVPFAALWFVSLARVAWLVVLGGSFEVLDTLAFAALVTLPVLLLERR